MDKVSFSNLAVLLENNSFGNDDFGKKKKKWIEALRIFQAILEKNEAMEVPKSQKGENYDDVSVRLGSRLVADGR